MSGSCDAGSVLLFTEDMQGAVQEIIAYHGAHVTLKLSTSILVAHFPPGFDTGKLKKSCTNVPGPGTLDKQSQLMLEAWKASQLKKASNNIAGRASTSSTTTEGLKWDMPGHHPPCKDQIDRAPLPTTEGLKWDTPGYHPPGKDYPESSTLFSSFTPTSLRMTGSISVGLIFVSGEPAELEFTNEEEKNVTREVLSAYQFLAEDDPAAKITFNLYQVQHVSVSRNKLVPNTGMSESPSVVLFNGNIYCFHKGHGVHENLWYNVFDGSTWAGDTKVGNTGMTKWPSAVVYKGKIYCLHRSGTGDKGELWYNIFDGRGWEGDKRVPHTKISEGPSCVVFQQELYCFHQGGEGNDELWYNVFDGIMWKGDKRVDTTYITSGPSTVVFKNKLYYFYRGSGSHAALWYNVFDGSGWAGDRKVPDTYLSASPSCIIHQEKLHCFHQGGSYNGQLWCNIFDGSDWCGDIRVADVSISKGPSTASFNGQLYCFYQGPGDSAEMRYSSFDEVCYEGIWRDPALRYLGYSSGYDGCVEFARGLKQSSGDDWSYVAFFTKYPLVHFAYAGGVRLCMQYANDGWGPDQIHRIFAHETCHIFGADDEYGNCGCGPSGYYQVNNGNCKNCTSTQVPCLMSGNELQLCSYSRGQIGWLPRSGLFVFHQRSDDSGKMWYGVFDGVAWWRDKLVHETASNMSAGPSAVMFKNDLYAFYRSRGDSNELRYNVLVDGKNWEREITVPATTITASPSAVLFNNKIYCFHAGGATSEIWYNVLDGGQWAGDKQVPHTGTTLGPCVTVFKNKIYCFHQGSGYGGKLWFNVFDGSSWQGDKEVPDTRISDEPSVVTFNNELYCFHRGMPSDSEELWYNVSDGQSWAGDEKVPTMKGISMGPSAVVLGGKLYCFFQGKRWNGELWYTTFDGKYWTLDEQVPRTGMSAKPSAIFARFT